MLRLASLTAALVLTAIATVGPAASQDQRPAAPQSQAPNAAPAAKAPLSREEELQQALAAAYKVAKVGPADVKLGTQGRISLPAGYQYIPILEAARLMRAFGNRTGDTFLGLVLSTVDADGWISIIDFKKAGYVKDDDARDWKADELLQSLKDGTDEANSDRRDRGFPELEVAGWVEKPAYDAATHRLVWSVLARNKGQPLGGNDSVNYNTYALGREGYYQLNLITGSQRIDADKRHAKALLAALAYEPGQRYEDFNPSTDRVAEYGLAALVAGAAAKKLGLLAAAGVFLLKFAKIIAVAVAGLGLLASKLFRRKG